MNEIKMFGKLAVFGTVTTIWAVVGFVVGAIAADRSHSFLLGVMVMICSTGLWVWFVLLPFLGRNQDYARKRRDAQMETYMRLGQEDRKRQQDIANKLRGE